MNERFQGSQTGADEDSSLLGYDAMPTEKSLTMF
jgi:hypothetical protein